MVRYMGIMAWACLVLVTGCASSSSSGIELTVSRGDATGAYAGTYTGTISLTSTADVVALGSATDERTETISVSVTADGLAFLTVRGVTITGVVDNAGNWGLQASIDDLRSLLSATNISRLNDAGCPFAAKAARIQGVIAPPAMTADVSGTLKCKRAEVTVATLTTAGTLTASR
ncbi:MAG TPA: hypothetical protein DG761_08390 [Gammaproteobacteria bacterium]|jgi:hypothetical protein|nr:hypothetical protein [Acidiferrobacteraceae bacterium]MDP6791748.1 hypothetical protein [Arenicellales bacterium]HCX88032.1 hypothetical protein [Gammaproteobacteria bacterium]|tara:strand:- start:5213 stop:5734 length:522 start_codon:yes stop_codon:yes gene_type:complete